MRTRTAWVGLALLVSLPITAQAQDAKQASFIKAIDRMMVELAPQSARASREIRRLYADHLDLLVLDDYPALADAIYTRGVAPLPADAGRFNLAPRTGGAFPIGEKDLANQTSYIAARPATIGALLEIASRVKSGPVEVTSLVRHTDYQGALRSTNRNATTSVPMHTMGLAFDIALVNTPLSRAHEIRDVLLALRDERQILFIGERRQLVFHVVPHPSRLGHFTDVYARALGAAPGSNTAHVVAFSSAGVSAKAVPQVSAEVVAVLPAVGFGEEWWAADHDHGDLAVEVVGVEEKPRAADAAASNPADAGWFGAVMALALVTAFVIARRPPSVVSALAWERPLSSV